MEDLLQISTKITLISSQFDGNMHDKFDHK